MRKTFLYLGVLTLMICAIFSSCASERNGCPAAKGYSGYGH